MLPVTVTDSELRYLWESGAFRGHHGATQPEDLTTTKAAEKPQAQRYSHVARKYRAAPAPYNGKYRCCRSLSRGVP